MINEIFDKKDEKNRYIDSEIDKFLNNYGDTNISINYDKNKNKFNTEEITKSLKKLHNKLILANLMKSIINLWIML